MAGRGADGKERPPVIDLHVHSTFSDGSWTPEEIAQEARRLGLTAVALTDHDGMAGVGRFLVACAAAGVRGIPGVEVSVDAKTGSLHMLGYLVDPAAPALARALARIREGRAARNAQILRKLNALGYPLTWEAVAKFAGTDVVGRPHFARALVEGGYARNKEDVFNRLLGKGKPAYVDRDRLTVEEGIALIRDAGGVPVLAHPFQIGLHRKGLRALVTDLAAKGLRGIEAHYPEHDPNQRQFCVTLAKEFDLAVTGGSDFHGTAKSALKLGTGFGDLCVPDELVEALYERATPH
jgi:predicted metal-dependent phosphoesterase TrpH